MSDSITFSVIAIILGILLQIIDFFLSDTLTPNVKTTLKVIKIGLIILAGYFLIAAALPTRDKKPERERVVVPMPIYPYGEDKAPEKPNGTKINKPLLNIRVGISNDQLIRKGLEVLSDTSIRVNFQLDVLNDVRIGDVSIEMLNYTLNDGKLNRVTDQEGKLKINSFKSGNYYDRENSLWFSQDLGMRTQKIDTLFFKFILKYRSVNIKLPYNEERYFWTSDLNGIYELPDEFIWVKKHLKK